MDKQIRELKKQVKGNYKRVAEKAKVSVATVSLVLNGKYLNEKVITAALQVRDDLIIERQQIEQRLINKLKS